MGDPSGSGFVKPRWASRGFGRLSTRLARDYPLEACAVGLGREGRVKVWVVVRNRQASAHRFSMDETDLIRTLQTGARLRLDPLVFCHTHPDRPPFLSPNDRAALRVRGRILWPTTWHLVLSVSGDGFGPARLWPPGG